MVENCKQHKMWVEAVHREGITIKIGIFETKATRGFQQ